MPGTLPVLAAALLLATGLAGKPLAQPAAHGGPTVSLQGDGAAWAANPHMRDFYDLTRQVMADGPDKVDLPSYREKSYQVFRAFACSMGAPEAGMVDHLKDIPRQMIGIVRDDPHVLDSYDNFTLSLMGPK